jgi:hypothetical protein
MIFNSNTGITGQTGGELISDTNEHTGNFIWMIVIEDTEISAITLNSKETGNTYVGRNFKAGTSFSLLCTAITLTSGVVKMIKGVEE